jgi:hypothetical protein
MGGKIAEAGGLCSWRGLDRTADEAARRDQHMVGLFG